MPTYNQAIREVILGRVESVDEKKRRIVNRVSIDTGCEIVFAFILCSTVSDLQYS